MISDPIKNVLLTRAVRLVMALPILVIVLGAGWAAGGLAAHAGWEGIVIDAFSLEAANDCDDETHGLYQRIRWFGPEEVQLRLVHSRCGR